MSFLSRLGLSSVAAIESNHGEIVKTPEKHSLSNSFNRLGIGASRNPIAKQKQKRFAISDLGFVDSGEDYPRTLELAGCSLASEMFIIFPGYQLWRSLDEDNEMLFQLFKDTDLVKPVAMVWVMYQSGLVKDDRIVKTIDHFIFFPGTYLFHADPESGEFSAEFNLLV